MAAAQDAADTVDPIFRLIEPPPGTTPVVPFLGSIPAVIQICDPWLNSIAQNGEGDSCKLADEGDVSVVTTSPKKNLGGIRFTYPSCPVQSFRIRDARDPLVVPIPRYPGQIAWVAPLCCEFTASPESGHRTTICATTISGLIDP
jgi:hypothetical protein